MPTKKKTTRKSKGKQHVVHATSLLNIATAVQDLPWLTPTNLARILRNEANRVQDILR